MYNSATQHGLSSLPQNPLHEVVVTFRGMGEIQIPQPAQCAASWSEQHIRFQSSGRQTEGRYPVGITTANL